MNTGKLTVFVLAAILTAAVCVQGCGSGKEEKNPVKQEREKKTEQNKEKEEKQENEEDKEQNPPASPSTTGALHVEGARLLGSNGEPVQLKGLSTHGLAWFPDYVNEEFFQELHTEWKANVVRLAMYTEESGGYCSDGDREYLKELIQNGVKYADSQDMYVIIDWHILSDADPNIHLDEAKAFFDEMSAEYAGEEHVLYEICNEPNGGTGWSQIKSYAEEVISVIRANDKDAVILVGTPNWSQFVDEAAADPITGYGNIMYTLHFYAATHTEDLRERLSRTVESGLPVFVSEYGICDASGNGAVDEAQAAQWIELLNRYGISYVAWNLSNKAETSAVFNSSCNKTSGFTREDLSDSGRWIYDMLTGAAREESDEENASADMSEDRSAKKSDGFSASSRSEKIFSDGDMEISVYLKNSWEANGEKVYQYELTLRNISDKACKQWEAEIPFEGNITLTDGWNADYSVQENTLHITSKEYNGTLSPGSTVSDIGFIVSGSSIQN